MWVIPFDRYKSVCWRNDTRLGKSAKLTFYVGSAVSQHLSAKLFRHKDVIAAVETQKGMIEMDVFEDGILGQWLVEVGTEVPVCTLVEGIRAQDDPKDPDPEVPAPDVPKPAPPPAPDVPVPDVPNPDVPPVPDPQPDPLPPEIEPPVSPTPPEPPYPETPTPTEPPSAVPSVIALAVG